MFNASSARSRKGFLWLRCAALYSAACERDRPRIARPPSTDRREAAGREHSP